MLREFSYMDIKSICARCGGKCCKHMPGITHPSQWGSDPVEMETTLLPALRSGAYCIDFWEGSPIAGVEMDRAEFVRASIKGNTKLVDPAWSGECIFLADTGCTLYDEQRPLECKLMNPHGEAGHPYCSTSLTESKRSFAIEWLRYADLLERVKKIILDERESC